MTEKHYPGSPPPRCEAVADGYPDARCALPAGHVGPHLVTDDLGPACGAPDPFRPANCTKPAGHDGDHEDTKQDYLDRLCEAIGRVERSSLQWAGVPSSPATPAALRSVIVELGSRRRAQARAEQRVKELEARLEEIGKMYSEAAATAALNQTALNNARRLLDERKPEPPKPMTPLAEQCLEYAGALEDRGCCVQCGYPMEDREGIAALLRTVAAQLEASAAGGCVTIAWEPENNRVVVTYDNAPSSVRVVTRRS